MEDPPTTSSYYSLAKGHSYFHTGEIALAFLHFVEVARRKPDTEETVVAHQMAGVISCMMNVSKEPALVYLYQAAQLVPRFNNPPLMIAVLRDLGETLYIAGRRTRNKELIDKGLESFNKGLNIAEIVLHQEGLSQADITLVKIQEAITRGVRGIYRFENDSRKSGISEVKLADDYLQNLGDGYEAIQFDSHMRAMQISALLGRLHHLRAALRLIHDVPQLPGLHLRLWAALLGNRAFRLAEKMR
ncbi:MAG: hypothetical protein JWO54_724 [Candidatus Saccharibacteria bacterium]|nr:hypothetical protein [Candidatus Saccharibacteria bacterium]